MKPITRRAASIVMVMSLVVGVFSLSPNSNNVKATWNGWHDVMAPTAKNTTAWSYAYGLNAAKELDGSAICLGGSWSYVRTSDFTDPSYTDYIAPYDNRSDFPDDNATFYYFKGICIWWMVLCSATSYYRVYLEQLIAGNYSTIYASQVLGGTGSWQDLEWNVTGLRSWTGAELKDPTLFRITLMDQGVMGPVYVDYIGWHYIWQSTPTPWSPGGGPSASWISSTFIVALGGVGFIGMIAYPGLAIYSYKSKDEKLNSVVGFIVGEVLFIGMLWFALSVLTGNI
jgi:hypothetical protein